MLILLPPSETKRGGGDGPALALTALSFPALTEHRQRVLAELDRLSRDPVAARRVLKLGPKSLSEAEHNRLLFAAPTRPALDRYTGVVYDALAADTLPASAREFARRHLVIHSAAFGLLGAEDPIPAYRLSHDSGLPGLRLAAHWREVIEAQLALIPGLVLDLRSEGYVGLGPAPGSLFLRVVTEDASGVRRALNHFNKKAKGEFVRSLLLSEEVHPDVDALLRWAQGAGIRLEQSAEGELTLVTETALPG